MCLLLPLALLLPLHPTLLGTSKPAQSLTADRVKAVLPAAQRAPWLDYLRHSAAQLSFDQDELFVERSHLTGPPPPLPKGNSSARSIPLDREPAFYASPEALRIADTILSFQIPNGGWSKNLDMSGPPRLPGQSYASDNLSKHPSPDDFDAPRDPHWNYVGTLDNDAINTELHFLAKVSAANPGPAADRVRKSFIRGVYYLLNAEYPNGGWPQVWPLEGGYHDAITFNDNAVTESAALLQDVSNGTGAYAFVPADLRGLAAKAAARALECILATQIVLHGQRTAWAQQHDPLSLAPVAGRNYEPAALSAAESADLLLFLMRLPYPSPAIRASIAAGITWLQSTAIYGQAWVGGPRPPSPPGIPALTPNPRHLEPTPGAGPLWARYYSLETGQPIFGDRDKTIHDTVLELSTERRNGYAWYSSSPKAALERYSAWERDHPAP